MNKTLEFPIAIVIAYAAIHSIWRQLVFGDYSFVVLRVVFLCVLFVLSARWYGIIAVRQELLRVLFFPKDKLRQVLFLMMAILIARVLVKFIIQEVPIELDLRSFFNECIIPPINEEMVFRWVLLGSMLQYLKSSALAVILSALLFSSSHVFSGLIGVLPTLVLGLIVGYAYFSIKSLSVCIFLHALWNCMIFIGNGYAGRVI